MPADNPNIDDAIIVHFNSISDVKPWKNSFVYRSFQNWSVYYDCFIKNGGINYPVINCTQDNFFNSSFTIKTLRFIERYSSLLKMSQFELYKLNVYFDFDFSRNSCRFNISNLPNSIYFEFYSSNSIKYEISFVVFGRHLLTEYLKSQFIIAFQKLQKSFENIKFVHSDSSIILRITAVPLNEINYTFVHFYKCVYKEFLTDLII